MANSPNMNFALVLQNQSQKEITVNEAFITLDSILNNGVIDIIDSLLDNPTSGDLYIISDNPADQLKTKAGYLAYFYVNSWRLLKPKTGLTLWLNKASYLLTFANNSWMQTQNRPEILLTNSDTSDSICKTQPINLNLSLETNTNFIIPTKVQLTTSQNHTFTLIGTNEDGQKIQESIQTTSTTTISTNWFSSLETITTQNADITGSITIGNISSLVRINSPATYITLNSNASIRIQQNITPQEYKIVILSTQNNSTITWEPQITFHNNGGTPNTYYVVVTSDQVIGISQ